MDCFTFSMDMMWALLFVPLRIHRLPEVSADMAMEITRISVSGASMITFSVE